MCVKDAQGLVLFWRKKSGGNRQKKPERSGARSSLTPAQMGESTFSERPICCAGARPNLHYQNQHAMSICCNGSVQMFLYTKRKEYGMILKNGASSYVPYSNVLG